MSDELPIAASYAFLPGALIAHRVEHYIENLATYQSSQTKFEMVEDNPEPVLLDTVEGNDKEAVSSRA